MGVALAGLGLWTGWVQRVEESHQLGQEGVWQERAAPSPPFPLPLHSLHSWLGLATIALVAGQLLMGNHSLTHSLTH